jgi:hypothetical protein
MDVWRYSDWYGWRKGKDVPRSHRFMWRWRGWIVESLNKDKGYDRMVMEMIAADEIAPKDTDALRATGFLVRNCTISTTGMDGCRMPWTIRRWRSWASPKCAAATITSTIPFRSREYIASGLF